MQQVVIAGNTGHENFKWMIKNPVRCRTLTGFTKGGVNQANEKILILLVHKSNFCATSK